MKEIDPLFKKFKNKIFVIKIGGEVLEKENVLENLLKSIKSIFKMGIKVILVHGGGRQADDLAKRLGHEPQKIKGRRITKKTDLEIAKMLFGGSLNLDILKVLKKISFKGIRVSGLDGNLLELVKRPIKKVNFGLVGDIKKINPQILIDLLALGYLPIVSPLGVTKTGEILNINADTVATEIAICLKAEKLILLTKTSGVYNKNNELFSSLTPQEAKELIKERVIKEGMEVKITNCINALGQGLGSIHIISGMEEKTLLKKIFTKRGVGTTILLKR